MPFETVRRVRLRARWAWLSGITLVVLAGSASSQTWRVDYDASLGTLPSAQGWTHFVDDPAPIDGLSEANYQVLGGPGEFLLQGPTGGVNNDHANRQWYEVSPPAFDFDQDVIEVSLFLRTEGSTMTPPPSPGPRAGFGVSVSDAFGRLVILYVGSSGLFLYGSNQGTSELVSLDTSAGLFEYTLRIDDEGASVRFEEDDVLPAYLPRSSFGVGAAPNRVSFGDLTINQESSSEISLLSFGRFNPPVSEVRNVTLMSAQSAVDSNPGEKEAFASCETVPGSWSGRTRLATGARVFEEDAHPFTSIVHLGTIFNSLIPSTAVDRSPILVPWSIRADAVCGEMPGISYSSSSSLWAGVVGEHTTDALCPPNKVAISGSAGAVAAANEALPTITSSQPRISGGQLAGWRTTGRFDPVAGGSPFWNQLAESACSDARERTVVTAANPVVGSSGGATALCPAGHAVIGGGGRVIGARPTQRLVGSHPTTFFGTGSTPVGWIALAHADASTVLPNDMVVEATAICVPIAEPTVARHKLGGRWRADGGYATDERGQNDGILMNGATIVPGLMDQAFSFEEANDEWLSIPGADFYPSGSFSVSAFFQTSTLTGEPAWIASLYNLGGINVGPANFSHWFLRLTAEGFGQVSSRQAQFPNAVTATGTEVLTDGNPHHIALVRAVVPDAFGNERRLELWVDGIRVAVEPLTVGLHDGAYSPSAAGGPDPISVGVLRESGTTNVIEGFDGLIDDLKYYDRALTREEIENMAGCGVPILPRVLNLDASRFGGPDYIPNSHRLCVYLEAGDYQLTMVSPAEESLARFTAWSDTDHGDWGTAYTVVGETTLSAGAGLPLGEPSMQLAFDNTQNKTLSFSLPAAERVYFAIEDVAVLDNQGGVSLRLEAPEPGLGAMIVSGIALLGMLGRGRSERRYPRVQTAGDIMHTQRLSRIPFIRWALIASVAIFVAGTAAAQTWRIDYDASLGTLPSAQGWTHTASDPLPTDGLTEANYSVVAGVLTQGPTGGVSGDVANRQSYDLTTQTFDFDEDVIEVRFRLKILSSTLTPPGSPAPRAGFGVSVVDAGGQLVALYIGNSGLFLYGSNQGTSALVPFDATAGFTDFRLRIDDTGASVWKDDAGQHPTNGTTDLAFIPRNFFGVTVATSSVSIGDLTILEQSSSELMRFTLARFSAPVTEVRNPTWRSQDSTVSSPAPTNIPLLDFCADSYSSKEIAGGAVVTGTDVGVTLNFTLPIFNVGWGSEAFSLPGGPTDWGLDQDVICGEVPGHFRVTNIGLEDTDPAKTITASCPSSKTAISGGFGFSSFDTLTRHTGPTSGTPSGWQVHAENPNGTEWSLQSRVVCSDARDWLVVTTVLGPDASPVKSFGAACPSPGENIIVGGGVRILGDPAGGRIIGTYPEQAYDVDMPVLWVGKAVADTLNQPSDWSLEVTAICGPIADPTVARRDLVGRWTAYGGYPNDERGQNNGTLLNGASIVPGLLDQAFSFDEANDEWLSIPGGNFYPSGSFSVSAFFQTSTTTGAPATIASLYDLGGINVGVPNLSAWSLQLTTEGFARVNSRKAQNAATLTVTGSDVLTDGQPHHIALVRAVAPDVFGNVRRLELWVDGVRVGFEPLTVGLHDGPYFPSNAADPDPISVGALRESGTTNLIQGFDGLIDDLIFHDRALTREEIENMAGCGVPILPRVLNLDASRFGGPDDIPNSHRLCVYLEAGDYTVTMVSPVEDPLARFSAWSDSGTGDWGTAYSVISDSMAVMSGSGIPLGELSMQDAFDNTTVKTLSFSLPSAERVYFGIEDGAVLDNQGGVSLRLEVPEPGLGAMIVPGIALLSVFGPRRSIDRRERG